jgi:hypothetical protein
VPQEIVDFLLSPEARDLRPLLLGELVDGADLFLRDQLRRAHARLPSLAPRLPLLGALPAPPPPPVFVPGLGLMQLRSFVDAVAPPLTQPEEIYLQSMRTLGVSLLGARPHAVSRCPYTSCSLDIFTCYLATNQPQIISRKIFVSSTLLDWHAPHALMASFSATGTDMSEIRAESTLQMLLNPSVQLQELQKVLSSATSNRANVQVMAGSTPHYTSC